MFSSTDLAIKGSIDSALSIVPSSLTGGGFLEIKNAALEKAPIIEKISNKLQLINLKEPRLSDTKIQIEFISIGYL